MSQAVSTTLLVLGESDVGKTHYGAQLLLRLNQQTGALRMHSAPNNVSAYEEAIHRLNEGCAADHTSSGAFLESCWPVIDGQGNRTNLLWPDYAGEQVRQIRNTRRVGPEWRERLCNSAGWMLFIRPHLMNLSDDIFSRPLARLCEVQPSKSTFQMSDQARSVELLQLLLHIRGVGTLNRISSPSLMILLSCWDELGIPATELRPTDALASRLPLLADFVASNWRPERYRVYGLSALGRSLSKDSPDSEYRDKGPEHFGYFVGEDGSHHADLTLPVADLAALAR